MSRSSIFDLGIPSVLFARKPTTRLLVFSIISCMGLWFLYTISYPSDYPHPHHHNKPPFYRHDPIYHRPQPLLASESSSLPSIWSERAIEVRKAYLHAYTGYMQYAGEHDELLPVVESHVDNFNGWRLTLVDSLDTMWIMGLHTEFQDSMSIVANLNFTLEEGSYAPFFETVIRYLGGLLSAYALSGEGVLLRRADELGTMLLPAFNTSSGLPMFAVNTASGHTRTGWSAGMLWSEGLSCQMEYKYLAHLTGRTEYYDKVERIMSLMDAANVKDGLFPTTWSVSSGEPMNEHFSVGAFSDSAYEYLLKQYLLTGNSEPRARKMYTKAVNGIINNLLYISPNRHLLFVTDVRTVFPSYILEHLSCFLPGLLALGAHKIPEDELHPDERELHKWAAEGLANTCWLSYHDSKTGLGPDEMFFPSDSIKWVDALKKWDGKFLPPGLADGERKEREDRDYTYKSSAYLLRPETVETFYIMWRTTGDEKWRDRGWEVFTSIERETKTRSGYASLMNVDESPSGLKDEMPSFFMAETLKYLYLLFTDEELIPLDKWVFNTEAHPLPIFNWSQWQKTAQGIP